MYVGRQAPAAGKTLFSNPQSPTWILIVISVTQKKRLRGRNSLTLTGRLGLAALLSPHDRPKPYQPTNQPANESTIHRFRRREFMNSLQHPARYRCLGRGPARSGRAA